MWKTPNKTDIATQMEECYNELMEQCKYSHPGAKLSLNLRMRIEKFSANERQEIVSRAKTGCAPLFVACRKGKTEIVEYLITVCRADIEQRGLYEVPDERSAHDVTPLWCAAVAGRLSVVKCLLHYGANINAVSDTGSTPVRSACFMTNLDIVKLLVEMGADINKPNYNGGTCLINSVQSAALCEFLLEHGADVNARDIQDKTALHYAIQEHRLETAQLLIERGADCHARSRYGDDALRTACIKGAINVFEYLTDSDLFNYSDEKLANSYELLGATCLIEHNDVIAAVIHWRKAMSIRESVPGLLPKRPVMLPIAAYRYQTEFESMAELEDAIVDLDSVRIQSLLITERILGTYHKDYILRLMLRGANYVDVLRYQRCIDLWRRALEIRVQKDSILYTDTCFSTQAVVRLMIYFHQKHNEIVENDDEQRFQDVIAIFKILTDNIMEARDIATKRPMHKRQVDSFDRILKCVAHLIYLMLETSQCEEDVLLVKQLTIRLLKVNPKAIVNEDTLLHLCVSKLNTLPSGYFLDEEPILIFPKFEVVQFLLECGAPVNAQNINNRTPLNVATILHNYDSRIVKLLLDHGAHIDQPDSLGECPLYKIMMNNGLSSDIQFLNYVSLKCLCATVICRNKIEYKDQIPKSLEDFMEQHTF